MPNTYDLGNLIRVRFCFPSRPLADSEKAKYAAGGDLPAGVGFDPDAVKFDHKPPDATTPTTYVYPATIVKEAAGQYHVDLDTTAATVDGIWNYRGYSTGNGQASAYGSFKVKRGFATP